MTLTTADILTIIRMSVARGYSEGVTKAIEVAKLPPGVHVADTDISKDIAAEIAHITVEISLDSAIQNLLNRN